MEGSWLQRIQLFCVLFWRSVPDRKWNSMKKKLSWKAVSSGRWVLVFLPINSIFADELPVQFMGVNGFHSALEQNRDSSFRKAKCEKCRNSPHFGKAYLNDSQDFKRRMPERLMPASVLAGRDGRRLVQLTLPSFKIDQL